MYRKRIYHCLEFGACLQHQGKRKLAMSSPLDYTIDRSVFIASFVSFVVSGS